MELEAEVIKQDKLEAGVEMGMEDWVGKGVGERTRIREEKEKNST